MLRHMVYPTWPVVMQYQAVISYQKLNLLMQGIIADNSKLFSVLQSKLDHLNSIWKSDTSWCTAAGQPYQTWKLSMEKQSKVKSPSLSVQQFQVQVVIPYCDTLISC